MIPTEIETDRLRLVLESLESARARIAALPEEYQAMLSADWLAKFNAATESDPWLVGFDIVYSADGSSIGQIGFKGPPENGAVEIAYAIDESSQGKGYATEAADALTAAALKHCEEVTVVRAHTLPEENASTRVLTRIGFKKTGTFDDPEDGPVWRWEFS